MNYILYIPWGSFLGPPGDTKKNTWGYHGAASQPHTKNNKQIHFSDICFGTEMRRHLQFIIGFVVKGFSAVADDVRMSPKAGERVS